MPVEQPNIFDRLSSAWKALRFPQTTGNSVVRVWSSMSEWDQAWNNFLTSEATNDPRTSSLVMSGIRWLGNRLPEAILTVREPDPENDDSRSIPDHQLLQLFKRPNKYFSGSTLWKAFAYSWIIKGDVYFIKFRNALNQVSELWYEPHWNVKPRWKNDGQGFYKAGKEDEANEFITYYEVDRDGEKFRVEKEDIIHFRDGIDPHYPRCGLSGVATILREIFGDNQIGDYAGRLLVNGGVPPYVLSIGNDVQHLNDEDIRLVKESLLRQTSAKRAGEPLVVANATVEQLGFSPRDMDMRVSRYLGEERFSAVTGIPLEVLQLGAGKVHSIYHNVSEARQDAAQSYLVPLWWHIAEELTVQLLPDFDQDKSHFVGHDISEVQALREDEDAKHKRAGLDYQNGIITRKEARAHLDYKIMEGVDDVYFVRGGSGTEPSTGVIDLEHVPANGGKQLAA